VVGEVMERGWIRIRVRKPKTEGHPREGERKSRHLEKCREKRNWFYCRKFDRELGRERSWKGRERAPL